MPLTDPARTVVSVSGDGVLSAGGTLLRDLLITSAHRVHGGCEGGAAVFVQHTDAQRPILRGQCVDELLVLVADLLEFLETELIRTARWPTNDEIAQLREINARLRSGGTHLC